jgi:hypothetical protein
MCTTNMVDRYQFDIDFETMFPSYASLQHKIFMTYQNDQKSLKLTKYNFCKKIKLCMTDLLMNKTSRL